MIARSTAPAFDPAAYAGAAPDLRISTEKLRCLMLWLTGACGAIVFIEPSPYEVVSALTLGLFAIGGLTLSPVVIPLAVLLVLINRTDKDLEDLRTMGQGFKAAGARVVMFDDVHDPDSGDPKAREREASAAQQAGIEIARILFVRKHGQAGRMSTVEQ